MVQFMIQNKPAGSPIKVIYGRDDETKETFLKVYDKRISPDENQSDEFNKVIKETGFGDNSGCYLNLRTGKETKIGTSNSVITKEAMNEFLKRYGVPDERIKPLLEGEPVGEKCRICNNLTTTTCGKCHSIYYCSKPCQVKDWSVHSMFCHCLPLPKKAENEKSIFAILLREDAQKPEIIKLPLFKRKIGDEYFLLPDSKPVIGATCGYNYIPRNPYNHTENLPNALVVDYRDNFFNDGSKTNNLIRKLTNNTNPHDWRGPVIIKKVKELDYNDYIDIDMNDIFDIIDYLKWYGSY